MTRARCSRWRANIFLAGDGLGPDGPQPFLDVFDLRSRRTERIFAAEPGVFEVVLGVLDPEGPVLLTSRETESEPPNLYVVRGATRTALRPLATPYPDLANVTRRVVRYTRSDGVALSGSLYLPAGWNGDAPLPTLVWIYPYEFSDREQAEQLDVRAFRFHKVKGPSPLAALLEGYAVLLNPTVPILYEGSGVNDDYIPQLVASVEAAVDHLVEIGVADPGRIAVAGRSYGAFSSANLLIHSRRFATAIAMSGAYNRTLTPFGFQREKRSFWEATGALREHLALLPRRPHRGADAAGPRGRRREPGHAAAPGAALCPRAGGRRRARPLRRAALRGAPLLGTRERAPCGRGDDRLARPLHRTGRIPSRIDSLTDDAGYVPSSFGLTFL